MNEQPLSNNRIQSKKVARPKRPLSQRLRPYLIISFVILIIEFAGLSFLQHLLLRDALFTSVSLQTTITESEWPLSSQINTSHVVISFDGLYAAYISDNSLVVADLFHHKIQKIIPLKDSSITTMQWLPDRERFLYAIQKKRNYSPMEICYYDADLGESRPINHINPRTSDSRITAIALSPMTNLIFVKIDDGHGHYRLYRLDIMNHIYRQFVPLGPGAIQVIPDRDGVLVENRTTGRVMLISGFWGGFQSRLTGAMKKTPYSLLGVDEQGRIFLVALKRDTKNRLAVFRGKIGKPFIRLGYLPSSTSANRVLLALNGRLYLRDDRHHLIMSLFDKSSRQIEFNGRLVTFDGRMLVTRDGEHLNIHDTGK